jgi:SNF2 family DNA or RNA helicase
MISCPECGRNVRKTILFCPKCSAKLEPNKKEYKSNNMPVSFDNLTYIESEENEQIIKQLKNRKFGGLKQFNLKLDIENLSRIKGFEKLKCLDVIKGIDYHSYQQDAVFKVLRDFKGRSIIADDVGLGKTIEAGMILKEYILHGLVKKVIILVPKSVMGQWKRELKDKFLEDFHVFDNSKDFFISNKGEERIITTYQIAEIKKDLLKEVDWDILIIDEAHRLRNKKNGWFFINQYLRTKYFLMLTATPLQNRLKDLYNLVSLIDPTIFGSSRSFSSAYTVKGDPMKPFAPIKLRNTLMNNVMIRRKMGETDIYLPERIVKIIPVKLSDEEKKIYDQVTYFARKEHRYYNETDKRSDEIFLSLALQKGVVSSVFAVKKTLNKIVNNLNLRKATRKRAQEIFDESDNVKIITKAKVLLSLIKKEIKQEKVIIFTERLATQDFLFKFLSDNGYKGNIVKFGCSGNIEKDKKHFSEQKQILLSTDKGSEGSNFQFCNVMINYDLHWNPMRIEQRIGRIHRIGQKKKVYIYNLASKDTIEENIVEILFSKLRLFREVIGEPDAILANLERDIRKFIFSSKNYREEAKKLEEYGNLKREEERIIKKNREYI